MKIIIREEQSKFLFEQTSNDILMDRFLKKMGITKVDILYWNDNGRDSITGTVYLYKNDKILGNRHGYEFFYNYDYRFNKLEYRGHYPEIEKLDFFPLLGNDTIIKYFSDKVENHLKRFIDNGYSSLPKKRK